MNKPTYLLCVSVESLARLVGFDLYIERMPLSGGPFKFSREIHSGGDKEFWGFGLYAVVSTLRRPAQV